MLSICFISLISIQPFGTDIPVHINVGQIHYIKQEASQTLIFTNKYKFNVREAAPAVLRSIQSNCYRKEK